MQGITLLSMALGSVIAGLGYLHIQAHEALNVAALCLILFYPINILICFWELCLCYKYKLIRSVWEKRQKSEDKLGPLIIFKQMSLGQAFSPSHWAYIWIDYARFDPSYADSKSAGYNIDVGNGHVTLIPSLVMLWTMFQPVLGPKETGILGVLLHYQMMYGTFLYGYSYFNNKRYVGTPWGIFISCVIIPNIIWIVFPLIGIATSIQLIREESFTVVWAG
ncbi:unnamed protein product [Chrysoparadoxa australica]